MDHAKIERINELARISKTRPLNEAEIAEQAILRREYLDGFRENMRAILENTVVQEADGTKHPLAKK